MNITQRVNRIIADQLFIKTDEIAPKHNLMIDLGADSLDLVEIIMALEEEFDMEIPDEAVWEKPCTVERIHQYFGERVKE